MEFGPRALGNRSILASPLNPYSTENLNIYIKHREPFRKFAASVPEEVAAEYFEVGPNARFLATVGRVRPEHRKLFESAILGDDLVRVHTVRREENPLFWELLHATGEGHRPAGALQHVLQPVRRSAGVHAARRRAQLLLLRHRRDVRGQFLPGEIGAGRTPYPL